YTSELNVEQELRFNPPVVVTAGTPAKLTVSLDLSGWFRSRDTLVDPATAEQGGVNEDLVRDNIIPSFQSCKDNDEDGQCAAPPAAPAARSTRRYASAARSSSTPARSASPISKWISARPVKAKPTRLSSRATVASRTACSAAWSARG